MCSANLNVPFFSRVQFIGSAASMYPTAGQFNAQNPGCTCTKWMLLDQVVPPADQSADGDDGADLVGKLWQLRNKVNESRPETLP